MFFRSFVLFTCLVYENSQLCYRFLHKLRHLNHEMQKKAHDLHRHVSSLQMHCVSSVSTTFYRDFSHLFILNLTAL